MRSTRKSEGVVGAAALGLLALGVALTVVLLPPEPTAPRWRGAGNESPTRGGTFVFHHESDVRGFDPLRSFDELSSMGIKLLFEGLIDYDDEMALEPRLAEALPEIEEEGRVYRFRLRAGVRFQDSPIFEGGRGREVTAEDVRWSLEHMLHPDTNSPGASFYSAIEGLEAFQAGRDEHVSGIRVLDRYTVEIRLQNPDQTFIYLMAMPFAYPVAREAYAEFGDEIARHPVGTGAYRLTRWEPGVDVVFERNPTYFEPGRPYVDQMVFQLNLLRYPAVMRFRNGDLDHVHRQSPADYMLLRSQPAWAPYIEEAPKTNLWGVVMNCQMAPFDNVHVRRAVAFAIRRDRWRRARANRLLLTGQPIPATLPGFDPDLPGQHRYDPERARAEMRLAGYPDGLPEPVEIWLGEGETGRRYGELLQQDLRDIGIEVRIRQVAFPTYLAETGRPGTAQMLLGGWNMDFPDPANFLDVLFHTRSIHEEASENRAFYSNAELDAILDEARSTLDRERRLALYRRASLILVEDAPWAFVWSDLNLEAWQPYVRGYRPSRVWTNFYRDLWLDLPRRRVMPGLETLAPAAAAFLPFGARR